MAASISGSTVLNWLQSVNSRPIPQRCMEIENIISSSGTKELRNVLPVIIENLFGFGSEPGWGLDLLCHSTNPHEFDAVRRLLAPDGIFLSLIYNLNADIYLSYEFPMNCIPAPTRHIIEEGGLPVFYVNKLQTQNYGRPVIALNAFEYYLFHFAYSLVNPQWQKQGYNWNNLGDCLYPCLLDDYLNYFLPLNKSSLPPMPHVPSPVRSPVVHSSMSSIKGSPGSTTPPKTRTHFGLLKASFLATQKQHTQSSPVLGQGEAETWRSETLLQVLTEFWLNQNPVDIERQTTFSHSAMHSVSVYGRHTSPFQYLFDSVLPSNNHVRLVRVLIKHIHRFVNTVPHTVVTSPYQSHLDSPLDEFKKSIIPHIIQKKLYTFLRHGFDRWPLDCSFRLMLETWLSYIQPWRYMSSSSDYTDRGTGRRDSQDMSESRTVEEKWFYFIEDNLLFYTVLLQEFIFRVFRMDLASLKNAGMLFRVAKVLNLPNLPNMLQRAERELCTSLYRTGRMTSHDLGGSYLSPETNLNLHTQISELERPGFQYIPLFGEDTVQAIHKVLIQVYQSKAVLTNQESTSNKPQKKGFASIFDFSGLFEDKAFGDMTLTEVKKLQSYLDTIISNLCHIFEIPPPEYLMAGTCSPTRLEQSTILGQSTFVSDYGSPDCSDTEDGVQLTPLGRYQIINRLRRFDISYQGDPDLQPIRSYENAMLVRLLYHLCSFINTQFRDQIFDLYERDDLIGGLAKVYFSPPITADQSVRRSPMSRTVQEQLESPRLSLRFLANYHMLTYIGILYLFLRFMWGFGTVGFILFLMFSVLIYGFVKALMLPKEHVS